MFVDLDNKVFFGAVSRVSIGRGLHNALVSLAQSLNEKFR